MTVERHLILQELSLRPSGEWTPGGGWTVVRVVEGAGYCLQAGAAREMNPGDMVIAGSHATAIFRASQLGILKLEFFIVLPQYLNGLLTVTEWQQLEDASSQVATRLLFFPANDHTAQKFTRIAAQSQRDCLSARSGLLQLWASSITGLLPANGTAPAVNNLRERFRQLVGKMSEAELATRSLTQLAEELHCSERHFSRLFREEFHISLRSRQTELRLQRARQLLAESDAKIISVAYESGYRHLGLFNAMFKRRFGVTPSQWRQQNLATQPKNFFKRSSLVWAVLLLLVQFAFNNSTFAQTTNSPAPKSVATSTNTGPHFKVEKYLITGNTVLAPGQLGQILTNLPAAFGTNVSFADIRAQLGDLQMAYRERGFVTVSVALPPQKLTNAEVKIKVTEGRLSDIRVEGNKFYSTPNVLRALPSLHTNLLLNSHVFQRELDLANANRNRQIYPVIGPGLEPGTTELTLKVKDRLPVHSRVEINNVSTPGTPDSRVNFNAEYDNLWQLEHTLGVSYSFTPVNFHPAGDFYQTPFDSPLIANYSAFYRLPLGRARSVQQQIDESNGHFGYNEITHQFQMPPPSGRPELTLYASRSTSDTGVKISGFTNVVSTPLLSIDSEQAGQNVTLNEAIGLKLSWPLPQLGRLASTFSLGADFKHFQSASYNSNNFIATSYITNSDGSVSPISSTISSPQPTLRTEVYYVPLNIGFNGSVPDSWGSTAFNVQANFNVATFGGYAVSGTNAAEPGGLSKVAGSPDVHDNYITLQFGADRLQRLYKDWTVKIHGDGQWANGRLFSNEQFGMGGSAGVRGYQDGQAYGDTGWRVSIEPQTPQFNIGMVDGDVPFWVRASVFVDYGQVYMLDGGYFVKVQYLNGPAVGHLPGDPSKLDFLGTGWTLTANIGSHFDARFAMAFPLLNPGYVSGWSPVQSMHFYFGVGAQF
jgi:hemolysin activation/secretion protein